MVETQLRRRGIHDERVLQAMLEIPREEFVPADSRLEAYQDEPIHIGHGQTISQPYMTALGADMPRRCWGRWPRAWSRWRSFPRWRNWLWRICGGRRATRT